MLPFHRTAIAFAPVLMIAASAAQAQKSDEEELSAIYGDKATVSIATGNTQPLRRAPAVATVITAEDIASMGAHELDEVLQTVPGLHVSTNALIYAPQYSMRGLGLGGPTNPQILFLQNGVAQSTLYSGDTGVAFSGHNIRNIARIEIIRGPGSALYGADAFAGVINIITKSASDTPGLEVGFLAGSHKTKQAWVQYGGKIGKVDTAAYLNVGRTDGVSEIITADAATRNDRIFGTHTSLAPGRVNNHRDNIDFGLDLAYGKFKLTILDQIRGDVGTGAGIASALDPKGYVQTERFTANLLWNDKNFAEHLALGGAVSYVNSMDRSYGSLVLFPPSTAFPSGSFPDGVIGGPGRWERQLRLSAYASYSGFHAHQIRLGLGHDDLELYRSETLKNFFSNAAGLPIPQGPVIDYTDIQPHILPQRRKVNYFYVQDEWEFAKDWVLTAGVRHDRYSDFGGTTNPRFALVWDTTPNFTTKLLYGRAFRAPSFNESYGINPVANGNPDLAPETINTSELATTWQINNSTQLNLNIFKFTRKNIIVAVANAKAGTGSTYANDGNESGKGLEIELAWDINRSLKVLSNFSYQRVLDDSINQDIGYAPHKKFYARVDWRFANGWQLDPQIN